MLVGISLLYDVYCVGVDTSQVQITVPLHPVNNYAFPVFV